MKKPNMAPCWIKSFIWKQIMIMTLKKKQKKHFNSLKLSVVGTEKKNASEVL